MRNRSDSKKLLELLIEKFKLLAIFVVGLIFVLAAVGLIRVLLEKITGYHWSMGLLAAIMTLSLLVWMLNWISKAPYTPDNFGYYPRLGLTLNLVLIVLTAVVAMSFVSGILLEFEIVSYQSKDPISVSRLLDYYSWHFIDSIPFVDIWDIFGIEPRIEAENTQAKALLEIFHVLIVASVIRTFLGKKGQFNRLLDSAREYRLGGEFKKAEKTTNIAMRIASESEDLVRMVDANIELARIYQSNKTEKANHCIAIAEDLIKRAEAATDLKRRNTEIQNLVRQIG